MPWSNQGGGPWGSGKGPWGSGPQSSGPTPPDLEELLRRSQDKLRTVLPGGSFGSRGFALIALAVLALWGFSGFFRVEPDELVVVDFSVFWLIKPAGVSDYLFNIQNPEGTVKAVAESAMREVIGRSQIQPILTGARQTIEGGVQDLMQRTLDHYGSGIQITQVQLQKVDPPAQVIDAFRDVQAARIDAERAQNEAQTYANRVVPEARGRVAQITQAAEAYREQTVAEATGQAARFLKIYDQYKI